MNASLRNVTNTSEVFDTTRVDFPQFVIYIVFQFLLLTAEIYILASFSQFVKLKRSAARTSQLGKIGRKRKILIGLLMSVTVTGIIRAAQFLQFLFLPNHSPSSALACSLNLNIFYVLYIAGLAFLYIFLWFRQHTLYSLPSMQTFVPLCLKRFSDSLLVLIITTALGLMIGFVLANPTEKIVYVPQTQTCLFPDTTQSKVYVVSVIAYVFLLFFQGSLLFCFIYILRRHQQSMNHHQAELNGVNNHSTRSMQRLMKNCAISAAVCMITDIVTLVISFLLPTSAQLYNLLLFDLDYIVNLSSTVFCFTAWREMINPWPCNIGETLKQLLCRKSLAYDLRNPTSSPTLSTNMFKLKTIEKSNESS